MKISELTAAPYNPRKIEKDALEGLKASLHSFGDISGIVFNRKTGNLVAGHQRVRALTEQHGDDLEVFYDNGQDGRVLLPDGSYVRVRFVDWDDAKEKAANLAANNPHLSGDFTDEVNTLLNEIELEIPDLAADLRIDLLATAGDSAEFVPGKSGSGETGDDTDPTDDEIPEVHEPRVREGQLWQIGDHHLLCGDSTLPEALDRLTDGLLPGLILTDPPYAIYGSSTGIGADIADDKMVRPFFEAVFRQCHRLLPKWAHCYVHTDWRSWSAVTGAASRAGMTLKNCLIWDKGDGGLGSMYSHCHEFVGFFAKLPPSKTMVNNEERGQRPVYRPNILRYNRTTGNERHHNAAKPVELLRELMRNSSDEGAYVLDLFGGSGSTLVAAELEGRKGMAMEIEPKWCDVIITRMETKFGMTAELVGE